MALDPICGMTVNEKTAQLKSEFEGQTYYFCSPGCKRSFDKEPQKHIGKSSMGHSGGAHHG
jgi:YHS domain-containing protein